MSTAIPTPISISEYLHTSFQPDCDYVDGLVRQRNPGGRDHAQTQRGLVTYIGGRRQDWSVEAIPEVRIQTSASHVRVADVAVVSTDETQEQVIQNPPVAVIEILAPEDETAIYSQRLEDYRRMGIRNIWVVDPAVRKGFDCATEEWTETQSFAAPDTPIRIDLATLFAAIDRAR